jgi:hypothetical protein
MIGEATALRVSAWSIMIAGERQGDEREDRRQQLAPGFGHRNIYRSRDRSGALVI